MVILIRSSGGSKGGKLGGWSRAGGRSPPTEVGRGESTSLVRELFWTRTRMGAFEQTTLITKDFARAEI